MERICMECQIPFSGKIRKKKKKKKKKKNIANVSTAELAKKVVVKVKTKYLF